ncbi:MAG: hypothetical protein J0I15_13890 [Herbaspirillum huttiense]|uniref:hypothetical protein n=1 Tax=Herbaspirillum huttiense TaxID=863372 RepID=UPI001AD5FE7A|nr:hypothetical protein [Herbaspirillum huttiense]MBN9357540.1 hypothetical protein [Herbaspirillum huttiense]
MMNFPLNLAVGAAQPVSQVGNYVYYKAGSAGGADPSIKVKTDLGDEYILMPGQGFRLDKRTFTNLQVTNAAGQATIIGMLLIADGGFFDNRVTGSVEVIDGGKARTLAGGAFMGGVQCPAGAGLYSHLQLWNPPGSGKNIIIESATYSSSQNGGVFFRTNAAALSSLQGNGVAKLAGAAVSAAELRYQTINAYQSGNNMLVLNLSAGQFSTFNFKEPVVLKPGNGFLIIETIANVDITGCIEWYEESNA